MKLATFIGEQLTPAFYADPERLFPWTWKRTYNRQRGQKRPRASYSRGNIGKEVIICL